MKCFGTNLNYIGLTTGFTKRKGDHKSDCYNEKSHAYNYPVYKFIRQNNINWDTIEFEIISQMHFKNEEHAWKNESFWMLRYDSIENGQNDRLSYRDREEYLKQYYKKDETKERKKQYYQDNREKISKHTSEKIPCPICQKLIRRNHQSRHIKTHNPQDESYQQVNCDVCGKLIKKKNLTLHKKIHRPDYKRNTRNSEKIPCDICGTLITRGHIASHKKSNYCCNYQSL